ncbi:MAG: hypothetical protein CVV42_00895 [Candidatus Riflebacteria bacterium HGW-Riflebacteria-2]|jgi:hypothetical protein|nr:MAG: hypothetical protein CVV42_00895 [Candidatus Riflebacteria bacterium HGW-Riflebacteria-2]
MFKKVLFVVFAWLMVVSPLMSAEEADVKLINSLNYHKGMFEAARGEVYLKIPLGSEAASVGGDEQDEERYTAGVPYAFRPVEDGVWILDSVNRALKLFGKDGKLQKNISIAEYGPVVRDFAFDRDKGFWLLSPVDGFIYRIDMAGKLISQIEGFAEARAIETGLMQELLVDMPAMGSIIRFTNDEMLKEQYPGDESLSMIEGVGGKLLVLEISDKQASLHLRNTASPAENIPLSEFPLDIEDPAVKYVGARVIGQDKEGNIYLSLVACHEVSGAIYRDRIYRCTAAGRPNAHKDIIVYPSQAFDLPRDRVVTPDGRVMTFHVEGNDYVLSVYSF